MTLAAFPSVAEVLSSQSAVNVKEFETISSNSFITFFVVCMSVVIGLIIGLVVAPHLKGRPLVVGDHPQSVVAHEETTVRHSGEEASSTTQLMFRVLLEELVVRK